jgi:phospholipid N-methyltransferase
VSSYFIKVFDPNHRDAFRDAYKKAKVIEKDVFKYQKKLKDINDPIVDIIILLLLYYYYYIMILII